MTMMMMGSIEAHKKVEREYQERALSGYDMRRIANIDIEKNDRKDEVDKSIFVKQLKDYCSEKEFELKFIKPMQI